MHTDSVRHARAALLLVTVLCAIFIFPVCNTQAQREDQDQDQRQQQAQTERREGRTKVDPGEVSILRELNNAFIEIASEVTPSVVTVSTERVTRARMYDPFADFFNDPFFGFFGGPGNNQRQQPQEREFRQQGLGSGVIVSEDGYILTNNHVVAQADSITVRTSDGRNLRATVVGTDPKTDIAVIKVNARNLTPIKRGNSDDLQVGEIVLAVGSPLNPNLAHTVTQGIVSAKGRSNVGLADYEDFIQTDAAINPGNSGGALVNLYGELVGINTAIASRSGGFMGIGFAVPVNMALDVMDALVSGGRVVRGWLGVSIQDVDEEMAEAMGLGDDRGVIIGSVTPDGPADRAGIEPGDIIMEYNGEPVSNMAQLRNTIAATDPGTTVDLRIRRDDNTRDVRVRLGELPEDELAASGETVPGQQGRPDAQLGFAVANITPQLARRYEITRQTNGVVVVDVDEAGNAAAAGLREGDVIRRVNRTDVSTEDEFRAAIRRMSAGDPVMLLIRRGEQGFFISFTL